MVSRLDPRTSAAIGQGIDLVVDMSKLHVFDRDSEKAII
jgi:multiple sugar transport system ATP-binding protein